MAHKCETIVFSNRAYNAIIDETFKKNPIETGGILLGHIMEDGIWLVMEVLPPGIHSTHQYAYFEPDKEFINYLANSVASKYEEQLSLLGLWHRHPGSMDYFSNTDDETNKMFAEMCPEGAISGLVNVDPKFRLTMRHVSSPLHYEIVDFEVGDDIIPERFFKLKHFPKSGLNPEPYNQQSESEKKNSGIYIEPTSEQPSKNNSGKEDNSCNEKKKKDFKKPLLCWVEKALMIIGIIALLYLLFTPSKLKRISNKKQQVVEVKKNDKSAKTTDTIIPKEVVNDNKNEQQNDTIEKTQKDSNNMSSSRTGNE